MLLFLFLGGTNDRTNSNLSGVYFFPKRTIIHPSYANPPYAYDIALVEVLSEISFSELVQPIPLPPMGYITLSGSLLRVTGWGLLNVSSFLL